MYNLSNNHIPAHISPHSRSDSNILQAKVSPTRAHLAVNYNSKQIIVFRVSDQAREIFAAFECKDTKNRQTKILEFFWLDDIHILLINNTGIEVLLLTQTSGKTKQFKTIKSISENIRFFVFCSEANAFVCSHESKPGYLFAYTISFKTKGLLTRGERFSLEIPANEPNVKADEVFLVLL
ncbi:hypothetical protein AKO1_011556 [Acrasis kona]|uniref:Regulator of MON1-CCZ1 complex N-terminal domain-containing protein n=1 Tax=Acrasis kona TaxID=1008807 RepID=A0AAW2Z1M1_9EUKA